MKAGCGCFLALMVAGGLAIGFVWVGVRMLEAPEWRAPATTPAEGKAAQEKLFQIVSGSARSRTANAPRPPVVLSEREVNAFLSRHLGQVGELPLSDISVRLPARGRVEMVARVPLRHLLSEPPLAALGATRLPAGWVDRPVWLHIEAETSVEVVGNGQRRYLRLDIWRFRLGQQPLPSVLPRLLLDPATLGLLRWRMPDTVSDIVIERDRVVITRSS
jgi:hypothetical protein